MDEDSQGFGNPADDVAGDRRRRPRFKLNVQTVATAILIVALVVVVYMFFAPPPEPSTTLALPTATALAASGGTAGPQGAAVGSPAAVTTVSPVAPAPAGTPGAHATAAATTTALAVGSPASALPGATGAVAATGAIATGGFVRVVGTEGMGIRYRFGPGTDYATLSILMDGETLKVLGGPESMAGETWWRLQDRLGNVGWAAQTYLQPTAAPSAWAPPAASPTYSADSLQPAASATP